MLPTESSDEQIEEQVSVMNKAYTGSGLSWVLAGTTRTLNAGWYNSAGPGSSEQTAMKRALRVGNAKDLNVYTVGCVVHNRHLVLATWIDPCSFKQGAGVGLLGYSTFPSSYSHAPLDDGVVMLFSSLPGGTSSPYDLGHVSSFCGSGLFITLISCSAFRLSHMRLATGLVCTILFRAAVPPMGTRFRIPRLRHPRLMVVQPVVTPALVEVSTPSVRFSPSFT
jgi:hypothetical protein